MKRVLCALFASLTAAQAAAQAPVAYQQPPQAIREVLDAQHVPQRVIDPTGETLATLEMRRFPTIEDLSRPFLRLAGLRIDPGANGPQRVARIERLALRPLADAAARERTVALPEGGEFHNLGFSPDGRRFTLARRTARATELWLGDTASGTIRQVPGVALQNVRGEPLDWAGSATLIALTVSRSRGAPPAAAVPTGPVVRESYGNRSPEATYQDLLRTPQDEALFEHYFTAEITRVDVATGAVRAIGGPALYYGLTVAGDGAHLLVERLAKPFSYAVPYENFAREVSVIDLDGRVIRSLGRVALKENVPVQGVVRGPRNHSASPLADASIYWIEALDEGDPRKKVPHRDRIMKLAAPYSAEPVEVARVAQRVVNVMTLDDGRLLVTDFDRDRVWTRTYLVDPSKQGSEPAVLFDLSARDRYNAPGRPMTRVLPNGRTAVMVSGGQALFAGAGASPSGDRPFLDRWSLSEGTKTRLFQADEAHYENVMRVLDAKGERFVTTRESATEPPNLVMREASGAAAPLTRFPDPTPQIRAIKRELVKFKRKDGVEQSFWLYRPADQKPGERRPAFLWAYPMEYTDAALAGQVSGSPNRFEQFAPTSPLYLALEGFVVLNDVTMPVVGTPEKVNDTFVEQITMNAEAAIAKAAEMGVIDPARVAIGGHSYGAFMTVNLLAHTDLFKAGIARSGAYNRTLTPFGFQAERRTLWEAQSVYVRLSPFMVADKINEPLLLIHGEADNNSGTFPEQSDRLFAALAGTGGQVRLVKLPAEAHGYAARESVGHTLWEMSTWLHKHLGKPR